MDTSDIFIHSRRLALMPDTASFLEYTLAFYSVSCFRLQPRHFQFRLAYIFIAYSDYIFSIFSLFHIVACQNIFFHVLILIFFLIADYLVFIRFHFR